jgi:hypothetical protein
MTDARKLESRQWKRGEGPKTVSGDVSLLTLAQTVDALGGVRWIRWMLSAQNPQKLDPGGDALSRKTITKSQPRNTAVRRSRWRVRRDNWRPLCLVLEQRLAAVAACLLAPPPVYPPRCRGLLLCTILRAGTAEVRKRRRRWSTWRTL